MDSESKIRGSSVLAGELTEMKSLSIQHERSRHEEFFSDYSLPLSMAPNGATPRLQVFSVCINAPIKPKKPMEIYGNITIVEEQGLEFKLFDRTRDDPEIIHTSGASLSFRGPKTRAISTSNGATLTLLLKDCDQDESESFIEHKITLHAKQHRCPFDKIHNIVITGNNGCSVTVYYTTIFYGTIATIDVEFFKNDFCIDNSIPADDFLVLRAFSNEYMTQEHLRTVIFNEPLCSYVGESSVKLTSNQVNVVPWYSSLIIDVYTSYHGFENYYGGVEIPAYYGPFGAQTVQLPCGHLQLTVTYSDYSLRLPLAPTHQAQGSDYKSNALLTPSDYHYCPDTTNDVEAPLLIVFSVCVNAPIKPQKPLEIYGNITIVEEQGLEFKLFDRSRDNPEIIHTSGASLSFCGPKTRAISISNGATLTLLLKDCDQDESESFVEHKITLNGLADRVKRIEYLYDKINNVVITGNSGGSVTVYYTTVIYCTIATIDVEFLKNDYCIDNSIPADDYLVIRAFSNKYMTQDHLRTVIFNEPLSLYADESSVKLTSKQVIVVPGYSPLIIDVYMSCRGFENYYGRVKVLAYSGSSSGPQTVELPCGQVQVTVDFGVPSLTHLKLADQWI